MTVRDVDTDAALPPCETGEIYVRGNREMKGYYKSPEPTTQVLRGGWLHTGDLGHFDAKGYQHHLTDRKKDVIISGGFNI